MSIQETVLEAPVKPTVDQRQADFALNVALLLGAPVQAASVLAEGKLFGTPNGSNFKLQWGADDRGPLVRIEVMLPLMAQEISSDAVVRMFAVQALLMADLGWWLTSTQQGDMQLVSVHWYGEARDVVAAIDVANAVAATVVHSILVGEAQS